MHEVARVAPRQPACTVANAPSVSPAPNVSQQPGNRQARLLALQKTVGNQAVQRLVRASTSRQVAAASPAAAAPRVSASRISPLPKPIAAAAPHVQPAWYNVDIPFTDYQFDPSISGIKTAAGVVKDTAVSGFHWIADKIESLVDSGIDWLGEQWESIKKFASTALDGANKSFTDVLGLIKSPLGLLADTLMSLDAQAINRAWAKFSGLISTVANGFKAMTDTLLQQIGNVWGGINGFATSLLDRIAGLTGNFLFRKLPDALQNAALAAVNRLKKLWQSISEGWERIFKAAKAWVDDAIDKVFGFVRKVLSFGINVVVTGILQFGQIVLFLKDLISNPQKYVEILAKRSVQAFDGVESHFAGVVARYFGGAQSAPAAAAATPVTTVHRSPAPRAAGEPRGSASWGEIGHGISETMGKKWGEFKANPMAILSGLVMDMILPVVGNVKDVVQLFQDIKKIVTGPLSASSLDEFWTSLLLILDIPILIYHTIVSILMRSLMVPLIVATFIPHPVVKGIAAAVGYGLLAGFVSSETLNIEHKLLLLKTGSTVQAQKEDAYNRISDSLIGLAMTAVIMVVMLILHFIANVMKGVYNFVKGRVFGIEPATPEGRAKVPDDKDPRTTKAANNEIPSKDGKRRLRINEQGKCEICASPCEDIRRKYLRVMTPELDARIKAIEENTALSVDEQLAALDPIDDELSELWKAAPTKGVIQMDTPTRIKATAPEVQGSRLKWKLYDEVSSAEFSDVSVDLSDPANPGAPDQYLQPKSARLPNGEKVKLEADFRFTDESLLKNKEIWERYFNRELTHYSGSIGDDNLGNFQAEFDDIRSEKPHLTSQEIGDLAIRKVSFGEGRARIGYGDLSVVMESFEDVKIEMGKSAGRQVERVPTKVSVWAGKTKRP